MLFGELGGKGRLLVNYLVMFLIRLFFYFLNENLKNVFFYIFKLNDENILKLFFLKIYIEINY